MTDNLIEKINNFFLFFVIMISEQGKKAPILFKGDGKSKASHLVYGNSANLFSSIIKKRLKKKENYCLVDFGSSRGDFLNELIKKLPQYNFNIICIDKEKEPLDKNTVAHEKICSNLVSVPLRDDSADLLIMRYVLQWDSLEEQKQILSELRRLMRDFAIVQHAGADSKNALKWRKNNDNLFKGEIKSLYRFEQCFSSSQEVENMMKEVGLDYKKIDEIKVEGLSDIINEKYVLDKKERLRVKEILGKWDYIVITTWVISK